MAGSVVKKFVSRLCNRGRGRGRERGGVRPAWTSWRGFDMLYADMASILTATDLVVQYGDRTILDGATLGIEEGDRIGLVGRNGCGKTTFLRILAGLQAPDSGEVTAR